MSKKEKSILVIFIIVLIFMAGLWVYSNIRIFMYLDTEQKAMENLAELSSLTDVETNEDESVEESVSKQLEAYAQLKEQNSDFIGWISIEGTNIDYPVMQSVDEPEFYLNHDFNKNYSVYGLPFLDENCMLGESNNLIIYGHHMTNETMFHEISYYKNQNFWIEHPLIQFNTLDEVAEYEVVACFCWDAEGDDFRFNQYTDLDQSKFSEYMANIYERQYYSTEIEPLYGDELLTLVTCDYTYNNGRFVLVSRKVK